MDRTARRSMQDKSTGRLRLAGAWAWVKERRRGGRQERAEGGKRVAREKLSVWQRGRAGGLGQEKGEWSGEKGLCGGNARAARGESGPSTCSSTYLR